MTNAELARALASRENVSIDHSTRMLRTLCKIMVEELVAGRSLTLGEVGTLRPTTSGTRFRPSKSLRRALSQPDRRGAGDGGVASDPDTWRSEKSGA